MSQTTATAYDRRLPLHREVSLDEWNDWRFQQRSAVRDTQALQRAFPKLPPEVARQADAWRDRGFRFQLTPYQLALVEQDESGNPRPNDPIWRQFFPAFDELLASAPSNLLRLRKDEYSPDQENWEVAREMLTPILHHKYDNRVILYSADVCLSYCGYCLRSLQSTAEEEQHGGARAHWSETLAAIRARPAIEEVILSGGDPLVYDTRTIAGMLKDIRSIPTVRAIRVHSRAFSHNPFRIDEGLCDVFREYGVTEVAVHLAHPAELTPELLAAADRIRDKGARTMLLAQIPLLKGVNDDAGVLRRLFFDLYLAGIKPYYLLHVMPNIPAASSQRTSVRRGIALMNAIGRGLSHPAMPEYILVHRTGKRTIPLEMEGTTELRYETDASGQPVVHFKSWRGTWETYLDAPD